MRNENENPSERKLSNVYLTAKEVARYLKCDVSTVFNWRRAGKLQAFAIGRRVLYKKEEIDNSLKKI